MYVFNEHWKLWTKLHTTFMLYYIMWLRRRRTHNSTSPLYKLYVRHTFSSYIYREKSLGAYKTHTHIEKWMLARAKEQVCQKFTLYSIQWIFFWCRRRRRVVAVQKHRKVFSRAYILYIYTYTHSYICNCAISFHDVILLQRMETTHKTG